MIIRSKFVSPRFRRNVKQGGRERREKGSHCAHAAQWTQVVRNRRSLLPDLFDRKTAKTKALVVRPDDVDATGITVRCPALLVGAPVEQWIRLCLRLLHGSPNPGSPAVRLYLRGQQLYGSL